MNAPRILHVTEAMGGGTAAAIAEFARSTPQYEHHLLGRLRPGSETATAADFAASHAAGRGLPGLARALRRAVAAVRPAVVHLHSSWAGLVGRLALAPGGPAIAYTPHCFAFERDPATTPPGFVRLARRAERFLAGRTALAVCVSPREAELAAGLGLAAVHVPNTTRVRSPRAHHAVPVSGVVMAHDAAAVRGVVMAHDAAAVSGVVMAHHGAAVSGVVMAHDAAAVPGVVTVGRVGAQKDPLFLLRVKELVAVEADWTWVGGGDPGLEEHLRAHGVTVTGWRPPDEVGERLARADAYLHTAAWESCPLALLEAGAAGLPLVARSIPALDSLGLDPTLVTPELVAAELDLVLRTGQATRPRLQEAFAARHTPQAQAAALTEAYEWLLDTAVHTTALAGAR
ncbi:glycosyltransferase [Dactylosporangium sp. CS-047395]|uniref:glycosyltransferase n=1 Tax=Dactylosporangium sp. CS-047395 TaxID=3239936 RepID=UPI003D932984